MVACYRMLEWPGNPGCGRRKPAAWVEQYCKIGMRSARRKMRWGMSINMRWVSTVVLRWQMRYATDRTGTENHQNIEYICGFLEVFQAKLDRKWLEWWTLNHNLMFKIPWIRKVGKFQPGTEMPTPGGAHLAWARLKDHASSGQTRSVWRSFPGQRIVLDVWLLRNVSAWVGGESCTAKHNLCDDRTRDRCDARQLSDFLNTGSSSQNLAWIAHDAHRH